jgi:rSAM-partnered protein
MSDSSAAGDERAQSEDERAQSGDERAQPRNDDADEHARRADRDGTEWHRVDAPRADEIREWEVFVRDDDTDPLRHVGSVSAPSDDLAHEQAVALFGHAAGTIWLCPTDETRRFKRSALGAEHDTERAGASKTDGDATDSTDTATAGGDER